MVVDINGRQHSHLCQECWATRRARPRPAVNRHPSPLLYLRLVLRKIQQYQHPPRSGPRHANRPSSHKFHQPTNRRHPCRILLYHRSCAKSPCATRWSLPLLRRCRCSAVSHSTIWVPSRIRLISLNVYPRKPVLDLQHRQPPHPPPSRPHQSLQRQRHAPSRARAILRWVRRYETRMIESAPSVKTPRQSMGKS